MTRQDLFTAALQIADPGGRSAYLARVCGGDAELRRRVEVLPRTHDSAGAFPSPLKGMRLKELFRDFQRARDAEVLRALPALERINGKPAADFWKGVDGR